MGLIAASGFRDLPGVRQGNVNRGQRDGALPGLNLLGERSIGITYQITRTGGTTTEAAIAVVTAAHQNIIDPATVCMTVGDYLRQKAGIGASNPISSGMIQLPDRANPLIFFGRPVRFNAPIETDFQHGSVNINTEWSCLDGLLYDNVIVSGQCGLPNPTPGARFPAEFNLTFGASSGGSLQMVNPVFVSNYHGASITDLNVPLYGVGATSVTVADSVLTAYWTVPAGATSGQLQISVPNVIGTYDFAQPTIYDLTALGAV